MRTISRRHDKARMGSDRVLGAAELDKIAAAGGSKGGGLGSGGGGGSN
jgi:hypothetical protein